MQVIYTIGILAYGLLIRIASVFNSKAKKWVNGRQNWKSKLSSFKRTDQNLYWFHCASLGEFEQGKPIMDALKAKEECQLVVSFFSPSGYEVRKNYKKADYVFYLPLDKKSNAKKLIEHLKPTKVFIVKYEFWANLIGALKSNSIPVYLVSGIFRKNQSFFKWYGDFFINILRDFETIFVQDETSQQLLESIKIESIVSGDTRYDRVMANSDFASKIDLVKKFCQGNRVFVVGSSWIEDDQIIMPLINSNSFKVKVIIAPHEILESRLKQIENQLDKSNIRYSNYKGETDQEVLIIDNIGMLMHLYQFAKIAYVGGGFKTGLHNILEPASFGVPVLFGPNHRKFPEAKLFIENGIGFEVDSISKLRGIYNELLNDDRSTKVLEFMKSQVGATQIVLQRL